MRGFTRQALVIGMGLAGLTGLVQPALSQGADGQAARAGNSNAPTAPRAVAAVFGAIDLDRVFKDYEKVKDQSEKFKAEALARQQELTRLVEQGKSAAAQLEKINRNSPDYQKWDNEVTKIKAELEAKRGQFEREFAKKESDTLAALYNEVSQMTAAVAKQRGMTFVVKVTNDPPQGDDPQTVMAVMAKTVVYNDPSADITNDVVRYLNYNYQKTKSAASDPQARPASAPAQSPAPASGAATPGSR
jgi:Skp family chaperone for outer membrane proteins